MSCCARTSTSAWRPRGSTAFRCPSPRWPPKWCRRRSVRDTPARISRPCCSNRPDARGWSSSPNRRSSTTVWGPTRMGEPRPLPAPGHMGVDYEERVDFGRLRDYRLSRAKAALEASECGAFLLFDFYNIRSTTPPWIGGALGDKMIRYALLTRDREPVLWDFGSAVRHHKLYSPWLPQENWRPGFLGFRGAVAPDAGLMRDAITEIKGILTDAGVA